MESGVATRPIADLKLTLQAERMEAVNRLRFKMPSELFQAAFCYQIDIVD